MMRPARRAALARHAAAARAAHRCGALGRRVWRAARRRVRRGRHRRRRDRAGDRAAHAARGAWPGRHLVPRERRDGPRRRRRHRRQLHVLRRGPAGDVPDNDDDVPTRVIGSGTIHLVLRAKENRLSRSAPLRRQLGRGDRRVQLRRATARARARNDGARTRGCGRIRRDYRGRDHPPARDDDACSVEDDLGESDEDKRAAARYRASLSGRLSRLFGGGGGEGGAAEEEEEEEEEDDDADGTDPSSCPTRRTRRRSRRFLRAHHRAGVPARSRAHA